MYISKDILTYIMRILIVKCGMKLRIKWKKAEINVQTNAINGQK